jgi:hypothetical protein
MSFPEEDLSWAFTCPRQQAKVSTCRKQAVPRERGACATPGFSHSSADAHDISPVPPYLVLQQVADRQAGAPILCGSTLASSVDL